MQNEHVTSISFFCINNSDYSQTSKLSRIANKDPIKIFLTWKNEKGHGSVGHERYELDELVACLGRPQCEGNISDAGGKLVGVHKSIVGRIALVELGSQFAVLVVPAGPTVPAAIDRVLSEVRQDLTSKGVSFPLETYH